MNILTLPIREVAIVDLPVSGAPRVEVSERDVHEALARIQWLTRTESDDSTFHTADDGLGCMRGLVAATVLQLGAATMALAAWGLWRLLR